jgi:hypothetical protein
MHNFYTRAKRNNFEIIGRLGGRVILLWWAEGSVIELESLNDSLTEAFGVGSYFRLVSSDKFADSSLESISFKDCSVNAI